MKLFAAMTLCTLCTISIIIIIIIIIIITIIIIIIIPMKVHSKEIPWGHWSSVRQYTTLTKTSFVSQNRLYGRPHLITDDFTEINTLAHVQWFYPCQQGGHDSLGGSRPLRQSTGQGHSGQDRRPLTRAVERLEHLQVRDALVILKNSVAMPKLLYLLRTLQCGDIDDVTSG